MNRAMPQPTKPERAKWLADAKKWEDAARELHARGRNRMAIDAETTARTLRAAANA